jgi:arylsulfatase A-like enzyme
MQEQRSSLQEPLQQQASSAAGESARQILLIAIWFGIVCGLVEGCGLLLVQRVNWERWGPTVHVSGRIVWISALFDMVLFLMVGLMVGALARLVRSLPAVVVTVWVLTGLSVYDWLILTDRLYHMSCLLLAVGAGAAVSRWVGKHEAAALRFWRRSLPWVLTVVALAFAGIQGGRWWSEHRKLASLAPPVPGSPNVLVVVIDTLRADHLSGYGYPRPTSPSIDRLAAQGVLFENAVSTCSWSFPSHVSLLTGRYQFDHGLGRVDPMPLLDWSKPDLAGFPTLGEKLEQRGYRTAAFSANRDYFTTSLGFERGFTHFEDYFHSPIDMVLRTLYGREFDRLFLRRAATPGILRLRRLFGMGSPDADASYPVIGSRRKWAPEVNRELLRWIDHGERQRPFFAFLNYFDVHDPYGGPHSYPAPLWPQTSAVDRYDDGIKFVDDAVGQLLAELEKRGLTQNTLIVITSDHGESLGDHGMTNHGQTLYRELVHVPLIFWFPGRVPAGVRITPAVTGASIPATVLNLLNDDSAGQFPEPDISVLWSSPQTRPDWPPSLSELASRSFGSEKEKREMRLAPTSLTGPMKSVVANHWHLIVHKILGSQLFDWSRDPSETHNLIYAPEVQETAAHLVAAMEDVLGGTSSPQDASAIVLTGGLLDRGRSQRSTNGNDLYRIEASPGELLTVEVQSEKAHAGGLLDPVLSIENASGELYRSCRNAADDHVPAPGISDPTPNAFDDICVNINPEVGTDSRLEIAVPASKSPMDLYVRVSDWNGRMQPGMRYRITVMPTDKGPNVVARWGQ